MLWGNKTSSSSLSRGLSFPSPRSLGFLSSLLVTLGACN